MVATITPSRWLDFISTEYLDSFIRQGGSSVKFAVPLDEDLRDHLRSDLVTRAERLGYLSATISAAQTRVHMIDQLFFAIADQVPWRLLSERIVLKIAESQGYLVPPDEGDGPLGQRLANANSVDLEFMMTFVRRGVQESVWRQRLLAKDFRIAMTHLCLAAMQTGSDSETVIEVITNWLTGRNRAVAAVKPYHIFSRISRSNARYMLISLLHWLRLADFSGVVVALDIARLAAPRNPRDGFLFYTKAQLLDAYEVLRQFIDATDRMSGFLMVVLPSDDFLDQDSRGRGLGAYQALLNRVYDEVHDQRLVNPMGALVRIAELGQSA